MKKFILPGLLAVGSLVFFSFKPIGKSQAVNSKDAEKVMGQAAAGCVEWDKTHPTNFVSCFRTSTTDATPAPKSDQKLAKY